MIINTNISAANSSRLLSQSSTMLQNSLARLSSVRRLSTRADDAAGTAVALRMNAQIKSRSGSQRQPSVAPCRSTRRRTVFLPRSAMPSTA